VDLDVARGEFVAIMGPSGCGKSTLLNLVAGLDSPSDGQIVLAGLELRGRNENDLARIRREHVGIVFQFFNLMEEMTALENVALAAAIAGAGRAGADRRARDLLDLLGVGDSPTSCRVHSRAGSGNGSRSPARSPTSRRCSWPTSPLARSTRPEASRCSSCSAACMPAARPCCS
jgi:ABC-type lipoprotein export system ATPase subunit